MAHADRSTADRVVGVLARTIARAWFSAVEVEGLERVPAGAVISAANHHSSPSDGRRHHGVWRAGSPAPRVKTGCCRAVTIPMTIYCSVARPTTKRVRTAIHQRMRNTRAATSNAVEIHAAARACDFSLTD